MEDVSQSLKICKNVVRQVDIRENENELVVLKCFVSWSQEKNIWLIFVEGGNEYHWEKEWKIG
jgi:hypothetical protein